MEGTVRLPFNDKKNELGDSYQIALKRFYALERRLVQNPQLYEEYSKFLDEYKELGHMMEVTGSEAIEDGYFIPHHAVFKNDSCTTKLRVYVFDASSKSSNGISLNDTLLSDPTIQEDLFSIVTRFRTHRYVLGADIEKMFRQVNVQLNDANFQKILWRSPEEPVKTFRLNTVTYGTAPASFLAMRALRQLSIDEREHFPAASKIIQDFYVDDLLTGTSTLQKAERIRNELIACLTRGGFHLRKWCSNEATLLDPIIEKFAEPHICLSNSETQKTLGIRWHPGSDKLLHVVKTFDKQQRTTKRIMLSQISSLFDPLGLLGPVIIKTKLLLQQLWQIKLDWDESVPLDVATTWTNFKEQLKIINGFNIPRQIIVEDPTNIQLHGFCDASNAAYGAVLYVRSTSSVGTHMIRLLSSKTRVAPIKRISLPRLELCATVLLGQLYESSVKSLRINVNQSFFWSDSTITLHWIKTSPHKLKTFVANRVSQIQENTKNGIWRHVPTKDNPADALSKGQYPEDLINNRNWKNGPTWLQENENMWPPNLIPDIQVPERSAVVSLTTLDGDILERFSSFTRMKRVIAYCLRFLNNCRSSNTFSGELNLEEIKNVEIRIIKLVQSSCFARELNDLTKNRQVDKVSNIRSLCPILDNHGILRVGGRLKHAELETNTKHPILLPSNNHVTELIIRETHIKLFHAGAQTTLCNKTKLLTFKWKKLHKKGNPKMYTMLSMETLDSGV